MSTTLWRAIHGQKKFVLRINPVYSGDLVCYVERRYFWFFWVHIKTFRRSTLSEEVTPKDACENYITNYCSERAAEKRLELERRRQIVETMKPRKITCCNDD